MNLERLILGPPGCGKTTRLMSVLEEELQFGVAPNEIAFLSFTKAAVDEAVKRVEERFGYKPDDMPHFRTLHSLCYRTLGIGRTDVMKDAHYAELGSALGYTFVMNRMNPEDGAPDTRDEGNVLLFTSGLARNRMVPLEDQWHDMNDPDIDIFALRRLDRELRHYKNERGLLDYTDMLEEVVREGRRIPVKVVIIDEGQDLSALQWQAVHTLFDGAERIYVAGDDDQAIYRWAGADVETFLSLTGQQEILGVSYRLPQSVYEQAIRIVSRIGHRFEKVWRPRDEPGDVMHIGHVEMIDWQTHGSWLVLSRNGYQLNAVETLLQRDGMLYQRRDGTRSVNQEHYEVIASWERLRKGARISGSSVRTMYSYLRPGTGILRGAKGTLTVDDESEYSMEDLKRDHGLIADGVWYDALDNIALGVREYYRSVMRSGRKLSEAPLIRIGTIHSVKGREADNVALMTDMSGKTFRNFQRFPDDEHRVFYVGATRARHRLFVVQADTDTFYTP